MFFNLWWLVRILNLFCLFPPFFLVAFSNHFMYFSWIPIFDPTAFLKFLASRSKLHFFQFYLKLMMISMVILRLPLSFSVAKFNSYFFMLCKPMFQYLRFYFGFLSCFTRYFSEFIPFILLEYCCLSQSKELGMMEYLKGFIKPKFICDHFLQCREASPAFSSNLRKNSF